MSVTTEQLEANKKLARDYIDQVFNQHNPDKTADFVTGDVIWHGGCRETSPAPTSSPSRDGISRLPK